MVTPQALADIKTQMHEDGEMIVVRLCALCAVRSTQSTILIIAKCCIDWKEQN